MSRMTAVTLTSGDHAHLEAICGDRNAEQKHVWRARHILSAAAGLSCADVAECAGVSRTTVWHGTARFAEAGADGLLRDKTRLSDKPPLSDAR
jgi:transposase